MGAAETAAKWWCEKLSSQTPSTDAGDEYVSALGAAFAPGEREIPVATLERFRAALEQTIRTTLSERGVCILQVDYEPLPPLSTLAQSVGLPTGSLGGWPWKTCMEVREGRVQVSEGYGKRYVDLPLT